MPLRAGFRSCNAGNPVGARLRKLRPIDKFPPRPGELGPQARGRVAAWLLLAVPLHTAGSTNVPHNRSDALRSDIRDLIFCVTTVSIVCAVKPSRGWARARAMKAW
jgi:hypothetical protein